MLNKFFGFLRYKPCSKQFMRMVIAFMIVGTFCYSAITHHNDYKDILSSIIGMVVGYYMKSFPSDTIEQTHKRRPGESRGECDD